MVLTMTSGRSAHLLGTVVRTGGRLHDALSSAKSIWGTWFFLVPTAMLFVLSWHEQRRKFSAWFDRQVNEQMDELNREREDDPVAWQRLDPDAEMLAIDQQLRTLDEQLQALRPEDRDGRQGLRRQMSQLREQRSQLDYSRRVKPFSLDASSDVSRLSRWKVVFLSRGLFSDLKGASKLLSRATLGCLALALIGVAGGTDLTGALWDRVIALDALRVEATRREIDSEWQAAGERTSPTQVTDDDVRAIEILTQSFARALSQNPIWRSSAMLPRVRLDFEQRAARRSILDHVSLPSRDGANLRAFNDDLTVTEHELLRDLAKSDVGRTRTGAAVAKEEGAKVRAWFGSRWERTKATILQHAAGYREPVRMKDLAESLVDRIVASAFDVTIPEMADSEIAKQARSAMADGTRAAIREAVTDEFHRVVTDLAHGRPYGEAISRARTDDLPILRSRAEELYAAIRDHGLPTERALDDKIASKAGTWNPPDDAPPAAGKSPSWPGAPDGGPGSAGGPGGFNSAQFAPETAQSSTDEVVDNVARRSTDGGRYALHEESIDALAVYEDHFPRSIESQQATALGRALERHTPSAERATLTRTAQLKVTRAGSFRMLRGFSRVGGVLIGVEPANPSATLDLRDLRWSIQDRSVTLKLTDQTGDHDIGTFDRSLVHQALAFAADGRPVAVTMTNARPLPQLKIHLHPSLIDTPLGCRVVHLDRLVDTYAGRQLPERSAITERFAAQFDIYNFAWASRLELLAALASNEESGWIREQVNLTQSASRGRIISALGDESTFGEASIFERKPEFFDPTLVNAVKSCRAVGATSFGSCVEAKFNSSRELLQRDFESLKTWIRGPATFQAWSGVRERPYELSSDLAFLKAPITADVHSSLWPFDFIVQVAFTSAAVNVANPDEYVDDRPVEFDSIEATIDDLVANGVRLDRLDGMLADLRDFTILQRLFRAALRGELGRRFPLGQLARLTNETAGGIPYVHTPRWNGSVTTTLIDRLITASVNEQWARAASERARTCRAGLATLQASTLPPKLQEDCDFREFSESADSACKRNSSGPACELRAAIEALNRIEELWQLEFTFGVVADQRHDSDGGCPPLAAVEIQDGPL